MVMMNFDYIIDIFTDYAMFFIVFCLIVMDVMMIHSEQYLELAVAVPTTLFAAFVAIVFHNTGEETGTF